ncbi:MAG: DHH family phosphoesterase [Patescibacteria group bacterium]
MEPLPYKQAIDITKRASNVVIVLPNNPTTDAIASSLALFLTFEKLNKKAKIVCSEFSLPPSHNFLPKSAEIFSELTTLRKFIVSLDVSRTKVEELSYDIDKDKNKLNIFITPKNGFFEERDLTTSAGMYEYDLIYVLDAIDLDTVGKLYDNNAEFFYHTPIINIDHNPANDFFGQINLVDITATSISEIIFELIKEMGADILNEQIATNLLAGIISKTKSFRTTSVTPKSLAIASHLVASGARREEIIKNLFQTKNIATLKLWGRVLARLKEGVEHRLVWSLVSRHDFEESGASDDHLIGVIDELIINTPLAEVVALLYEAEDKKIKGIVYSTKQIDGFRLFREYNPGGTKDFTRVELPAADLAAAEKKILERVKSFYQTGY